MTAKHQTHRRTIALARNPTRQPEQIEDPAPTPSETNAVMHMLVERVFLPVLSGAVSIREVITPAGGWERLEARHPDLRALPVGRQMAIALYE